MTAKLDSHFVALTPGIVSGRVVALFGAGVNLAERPEGTPWERGRFLPTGNELAAYLADKFAYPGREQPPWFPRVAQYISVVAGRATLYDELRAVVEADYPPTVVHQFFAGLPARMREAGSMACQLVLTTNYDGVMERAFQDAGEPFDVVSYVADGPDRGKFLHRLYQGEVRMIDDASTYVDIDLEKRSLVLKLHGNVDGLDRSRDSYVATEEDYVEYLVRADLRTLLPPRLVQKLYESHVLFLGYGLRDTNLQVLLHRMWAQQKLKAKSWAVQVWPDEVDVLLWGQRNVEIVEARLDEYVSALEQRLDR